jgi:hypothetical protein
MPFTTALTIPLRAGHLCPSCPSSSHIPPWPYIVPRGHVEQQRLRVHRVPFPWQPDVSCMLAAQPVLHRALTVADVKELREIWDMLPTDDPSMPTKVSHVGFWCLGSLMRHVMLNRNLMLAEKQRVV